ncbi:hypothetical protein SR39_17900 [Methylobacterium radiotolerans]|nr:hypothetical protein SR39_17900 [Methylobacterium radiotolerans]
MAASTTSRGTPLAASLAETPRLDVPRRRRVARRVSAKRASSTRPADTARATVAVTRSAKRSGSSPRARARFCTRRASVRRSISVEAL